MILRQVIMATQHWNFAVINLYTPWHICYKWFEKRCEFFKRKCFSKCVWWKVITLITFEWDDRGLHGFGRTLRWWLSRVRCEHEELSLSYKDQFVILHYLYSYQVQPLETVWAVAWSDLAWSVPHGYGGWGAPEGQGGGIILSWFGRGCGLVPFGITG